MNWTAALPNRYGLGESAVASFKRFWVWWPLLRVIVALVIGLMSVGTVNAQSAPDEYRIKAAFLFHFAQLIDWPPEAVKDNSMLLCTFGEDSFQGELENSVEGKTIGSRVLHVRHFNRIEEAQACNIVFTGKSETGRIPAILAGLNRVPVLTVGETDNFINQGGVLGFCMEGNKIRFEVNLEAAERARLKISSRLLLLARRVVGNSGR